MQLTVPEAAHLLNVSEDTVYRWIRDQGLPASQFGGRYHLNKVWLLEWAHGKGIPVAVETGDALPGLPDALLRGGLHADVPGSDKAGVLRASVERLPLPPGVDRNYLFQMLLLRENQGSTGFGGGIALPHSREPILLHIPDPLVAVYYLRTPVDFGAVDRQPVTALFVEVTPTIRVHLHLLSQLGRMLRDADFVELVRARAPLPRLLERVRGASFSLPRAEASA
jgi:PTS system nitrogen regulatory IIA component